MHIYLFIFLSFFLAACSVNDSKIKTADKTVIIYNTNGEIFQYKDTSSKLIDIFDDVLNGKVEKRNFSCPVSGEISFLSKDSLLFEAGFTIDNENCQYLMLDENAWKLTYRAGMFLSETLVDQKK